MCSPVDQVLVERLMHVPEERDAGHNESDPLMRIIDRYVIRQVLMPFLLGPARLHVHLHHSAAASSTPRSFIAKGVAEPLVVRR